MHTEFTGDYEARLYSLKELAAMYRCDKRTLKKKLKRFEKDIGERVGNSYDPIQVAIIFQFLGPPRSDSHLAR